MGEDGKEAKLGKGNCEKDAPKRKKEKTGLWFGITMRSKKSEKGEKNIVKKITEKDNGKNICCIKKPSKTADEFLQLKEEYRDAVKITVENASNEQLNGEDVDCRVEVNDIKRDNKDERENENERKFFSPSQLKKNIYHGSYYDENTDLHILSNLRNNDKVGQLNSNHEKKYLQNGCDSRRPHDFELVHCHHREKQHRSNENDNNNNNHYCHQQALLPFLFDDILLQFFADAKTRRVLEDAQKNSSDLCSFDKWLLKHMEHYSVLPPSSASSSPQILPSPRCAISSFPNLAVPLSSSSPSPTKSSCLPSLSVSSSVSPSTSAPSALTPRSSLSFVAASLSPSLSLLSAKISLMSPSSSLSQSHLVTSSPSSSSITPQSPRSIYISSCRQGRFYDIPPSPRRSNIVRNTSNFMASTTSPSSPVAGLLSAGRETTEANIVGGTTTTPTATSPSTHLHHIHNVNNVHTTSPRNVYSSVFTFTSSQALVSPRKYLHQADVTLSEGADVFSFQKNAPSCLSSISLSASPVSSVSSTFFSSQHFSSNRKQKEDAEGNNSYQDEFGYLGSSEPNEGVVDRAKKKGNIGKEFDADKNLKESDEEQEKRIRCDRIPSFHVSKEGEYQDFQEKTTLRMDEKDNKKAECKERKEYAKYENGKAIEGKHKGHETKDEVLSNLLDNTASEKQIHKKSDIEISCFHNEALNVDFDAGKSFEDKKRGFSDVENDDVELQVLVDNEKKFGERDGELLKNQRYDEGETFGISKKLIETNIGIEPGDDGEIIRIMAEESGKKNEQNTFNGIHSEQKSGANDAKQEIKVQKMKIKEVQESFKKAVATNTEVAGIKVVQKKRKEEKEFVMGSTSISFEKLTSGYKNNKSEKEYNSCKNLGNETHLSTLINEATIITDKRKKHESIDAHTFEDESFQAHSDHLFCDLKSNKEKIKCKKRKKYPFNSSWSSMNGDQGHDSLLHIIKEQTTLLAMQPTPQIVPEDELELSAIFSCYPNGMTSLKDFENEIVIPILGLGKYMSSTLFRKIDHNNTGCLTLPMVKEYWCGRLIHKSRDPSYVNDNGCCYTLPLCWYNEYCYNEEGILCEEIIKYNFSKGSICNFFNVFRDSNNDYILPDDLRPWISEILDRAPDIQFLNEPSAKEFADRYIDSVIIRIMYEVDTEDAGYITLKDLRRSPLVHIWCSLDETRELNIIRRFFSYEHFFVFYCTFQELDEDDDFLLDRNDVRRYENHSLSYVAEERLFSEVARTFRSPKPGYMCFDDWIWFLLAYHDTTSEKSLRFWFKILDLDGDGYIRDHEIAVFYEAQAERLRMRADRAPTYNEFICQLSDALGCSFGFGSNYRDILKKCKENESIDFISPLIKFHSFKSFDDGEANFFHHFASQQALLPTFTRFDIYAKQVYTFLNSSEGEEGFYIDGNYDGVSWGIENNEIDIDTNEELQREKSAHLV